LTNLAELLPPGGIEALSNQLNIPREQAEQGAVALVPSLLGGMGDLAGGIDGKNATTLNDTFESLGGAEPADNVAGPRPTDLAKGNELLGGIFGSKDVSRQVATHASLGTGLDPALLTRMLPILAMLVAGYMTKRSGGSGGLGGILGSVLGGLAGASVTPSPAGGIIGSILRFHTGRPALT
jgi:hypothetical protein